MVKNRIKELRLKMGLSQAQLEEETGISDQSISYYEIGKRYPKIDKMVKLADFFKVSLSYLQGEDKEMAKKATTLSRYQVYPNINPTTHKKNYVLIDLTTKTTYGPFITKSAAKKFLRN